MSLEKIVRCQCGRLYTHFPYKVGDQSACPECIKESGGRGDKTVKCKFCGKMYAVYMFMAGDQSACPTCRSEAERGYN